MITIWCFRLEAYDRNMNFKDPDATVNGTHTDFNMVLPEEQSYRDMNSDTPFVNFTETELTQYLDTFDKSLTKDAKDLYRERFLRFVRTTTHNDHNDQVFVKSQCRAQMKRAVTYTLDVSFSVSNGSVMEAQCECAAGRGPEGHCKHIYVLCCMDLQSLFVVKRY